MYSIKKIVLTAMLVVFVIPAAPATARNTQLMFAYKAMLDTEEAKTKLDGDIRFFFGDQKHPAVDKTIGTFVANKKTNAFNKSDERACEWAFLSAMISLQNRALREGGNAVINIHSYYKKNVIKSATEFECGAGTFVAGVALRGTVVRLK